MVNMNETYEISKNFNHPFLKFHHIYKSYYEEKSSNFLCFSDEIFESFINFSKYPNSTPELKNLTKTLEEQIGKDKFAIVQSGLSSDRIFVKNKHFHSYLIQVDEKLSKNLQEIGRQVGWNILFLKERDAIAFKLTNGFGSLLGV